MIPSTLIRRDQYVGLILPLSVLIALINALLPALLQSTQQGLDQTINNGLGHSFVIWFCLLLAAKSHYDFTRTLTKNNNRFRTSIRQQLLVICLLLLLLVPSATLSWIVCAILCATWLSSIKEPTQQRTTALIVLAVAIRDPICQIFLNLFADQILSFDARLSGLVLSLTDTNFTITHNTISQDNGYSLLILTGCSAFHNLSLALLLWLSLSLYSNQKFTRNDSFRACLLILIVLGINGTRLALMAMDHHWYIYLHDGYGAVLIDALITLNALLCVRRVTNE